MINKSNGFPVAMYLVRFHYASLCQRDNKDEPLTYLLEKHVLTWKPPALSDLGTDLSFIIHLFTTTEHASEGSTATI